MNNVIRSALAFFLATNLATAAEWYAEPFLLYTADFSDNRRLTLGGSADTFGNLVTGGARLGTNTETRRFYVQPSVVIRHYDEEQDLFRGRLYSSESSDIQTTKSDGDYARAEIELDWQATRRFAVILTYQYTTQERGALRQSADADTIMLLMGYRSKRLAVSR